MIAYDTDTQYEDHPDYEERVKDTFDPSGTGVYGNCSHHGSHTA